jgi:hypothetical protein
MSSAPIEMSGLASGVNDTFRQGGIAVGVAALGALIPTASMHLHDAATCTGSAPRRSSARRSAPPARSPAGA